jgi:hypothetical protein
MGEQQQATTRTRGNQYSVRRNVYPVLTSIALTDFLSKRRQPCRSGILGKPGIQRRLASIKDGLRGGKIRLAHLKMDDMPPLLL